jgi:hypothetical protein
MDNLKFTKVDLGNFDFHNWEENKSFTGKFERIWVSPEHAGTDPVSGVSMLDMEGARINLGTSYQITKFFDQEEENEVDFQNTVYRITHLGQLELKGGKSVNKFQFEKAILETAKETEETTTDQE